MIKKENKKIIFEAIAIVLITLILTTNVQANQEQKVHEIYINTAQPYNFLVFGWGYICSMTINGEEDKIGLLKGCLSIKNYPGWNAPENYKLYIFDKNSFKLYTKDSLPKQFTLENFSGVGYIIYINIPHVIDATKYLIIGKAVNFAEKNL
jgi:hypothetical protein